jgi:hypothetical protein
MPRPNPIQRAAGANPRRFRPAEADQNGDSARDQEDTTRLGTGMATRRASCMNIQACLAAALRAHAAKRSFLWLS